MQTAPGARPESGCWNVHAGAFAGPAGGEEFPAGGEDPGVRSMGVNRRGGLLGSADRRGMGSLGRRAESEPRGSPGSGSPQTSPRGSTGGAEPPTSRSVTPAPKAHPGKPAPPTPGTGRLGGPASDGPLVSLKLLGPQLPPPHKELLHPPPSPQGSQTGPGSSPRVCPVRETGGPPPHVLWDLSTAGSGVQDDGKRWAAGRQAARPSQVSGQEGGAPSLGREERTPHPATQEPRQRACPPSRGR